MSLPLHDAPKSLCILRLSAVGDICHTLPVVRTIQAHWPQTHISWIIGKLEASLVSDIPNIEFIEFDKSRGIKAYMDMRHALQRRRFDALLHMQMSLRSSVVNRLVKTNTRIGFDRARAKDLQWLFNNAQIPAHQNQHVMFLRNSGARSIRDMIGNAESFHIWQGYLPKDLSNLF